jgi:hypothetical protein
MKKIGTEQVIDITTVKNADKNKFLPVHMQDVRDDKVYPLYRTIREERDYMGHLPAGSLRDISIQLDQRKVGLLPPFNRVELNELSQTRTQKTLWTRKTWSI